MYCYRAVKRFRGCPSHYQWQSKGLNRRPASGQSFILRSQILAKFLKKKHSRIPHKAAMRRQIRRALLPSENVGFLPPVHYYPASRRNIHSASYKNFDTLMQTINDPLGRTTSKVIATLNLPDQKRCLRVFRTCCMACLSLWYSFFVYVLFISFSGFFFSAL